MKIRLLYDLVSTQPIGQTMRHGGGIYGEIVLRKLVSLGYKFSCLYDSRRWLNPDIKDLCLSSDGVTRFVKLPCQLCFQKTPRLRHKAFPKLLYPLRSLPLASYSHRRSSFVVFALQLSAATNHNGQKQPVWNSHAIC